MSLILPKDYDPHLTVRETQSAIKYIRDAFQKELEREDASSGPFNYADLIEVCPFDNSIALQKCTASQVQYMQSNSALAYYVNQAGEIDSDGYYYCGTISYVAEWTNYQTGGGLSESYTLYEEYIISDVVYEFLINNWGLGL